MKIRLIFNNGKSVELPCEPREFSRIHREARLPLAGPGRGRRERVTSARPAPVIESFVFIGECAYDQAPFETTNPNRRFCCASHRALYSMYEMGKAAR